VHQFFDLLGAGVGVTAGDQGAGVGRGSQQRRYLAGFVSLDQACVFFEPGVHVKGAGDGLTVGVPPAVCPGGPGQAGQVLG
jgi:hypothetical protein